MSGKTMTAHIYSSTSLGFDGKLIDVESDASNGLPALIVVGLGNKAVDEAKERVRSAIKNSGLEFPRKRITVNLAPADLPKDGSHLDLPIALAILAISKQIPADSLQRTLAVGELSLDGSIKPINGVINHVEVAKREGFEAIIVPRANADQASLIDGVSILPAASLQEVFYHVTGQAALCAHTKAAAPILAVGNTGPSTTLDDIYGQEQAKRALIIAAAGGHNVLFDGPPGSGKTMLARTLTALLPPLTNDETIEVTKLHSLAGQISQGIVASRPFRSPHHSASTVALVGGGPRSKPGEISLAHRGVLFLDELPEYSRAALEALRQPLEDKKIHINRANHHNSYPASFMLVATQNPCPCGFATDPTHTCSCSAAQIVNYQKKISGPLLDRIDLFVSVSPVKHTELLKEASGQQHAAAAKQILLARAKQAERFNTGSGTNALLTNDGIKAKARLMPESKELLDRASKALNLSARSYFKAIKVARTIADLNNSPTIGPNHISEALQYRPRPNPVEIT